MNKICFDDICREVLKCEHYIEWEHDEEIHSGNGRFTSTITCVSCTEVGQSYNIEKYPENCPHKVVLEEYKEAQVKQHKAFEDRMEKNRMWNRLNDIQKIILGYSKIRIRQKQRAKNERRHYASN